MSSIYDGLKCPVCYARFFEDEDIVFCPVCGAPHHRECWNQIGHCAHEADHGTDRQWTMPEDPCEHRPHHPTDGEAPGDRVGRQCPKCGRMATSDTLFCPYCGYSYEGTNPPDDAPFDPFGGRFGGAGYGPVMTDPLGGVNPHATIEGVPVMDVASFVAVNTVRYVPKFAKLAGEDQPGVKKKKSSVSWNWAAFLIPTYWLFFRKCYGPGIIALACSLASQLFTVPFMMAFNNLFPANTAVTYGMLYESLGKGQFSTISLVLLFCGGLLTLLTSVLFGMFGDAIYKSHCIGKIKTIKASDSEDVHMDLLRRGGVNIFGPVIAVMLLNFLYPLIISFL